MDNPEVTVKHSLDTAYYQQHKKKHSVCGDTFLSRLIREEERTISVLSDGLGSGIKANVLSTLTATMAVNYTSGFRDVQKSAETIMQTLPVCSERKISYATFTVVDIDSRGTARIINYDNPPIILVRDGERISVEENRIEGKAAQGREYVLTFSTMQLKENDRLILFSDGITQAGIGSREYPVGWTRERAADFAEKRISLNPDISARELSRAMVRKALSIDNDLALDDITCGVIHYRRPRPLLIVTGPPVSPENDREIAERIEGFEGSTIICGGTTAKIVSRELNRDILFEPRDVHPHIPPASCMTGIDLVTEGIITLHAVEKLLRKGTDCEEIEPSPAKDIYQKMLESDTIHFIIGTRINEAWQDPDLPPEIGLRRTIVTQIVRLLEEKFRKETTTRYV